ncbi:MAG: hypothetical protein WDN00_13940 [Limisphaerales bacterium]
MSCWPALLLGKNIFKGENAEESRQRILRQPIPDFRALDSRIDDKLNDILHHCLTRELDRRYATADELMYDLEYYIYGAGLRSDQRNAREIHPRTVRPDCAARLGDRGPRMAKTVLLEQTARLKDHAPNK